MKAVFHFISFVLIVSCTKEKTTSDFDYNAYKAKRDSLASLMDHKTDDDKKVAIKDTFSIKSLIPPSGIYKNKKFPSPVYAVFYTNYGNMTFQLFPERLPIAVENFVSLVRSGYYNGNKFFRIEEEFIIQAGDRTNTGYADVGYYFDTEFHDELTHGRFGVLSYANNDIHTNSSQFFITLSAQRQLDKQHPPFGVITKGKDVLRDIGRLPVDAKNRPQVDVIIRKIEITGI